MPGVLGLPRLEGARVAALVEEGQPLVEEERPPVKAVLQLPA